MPERKKPIILVVDDEKVTADGLVVVLAQHGYEAYAAYNVAQAVSLLDEINPDLVITDDVMTQGGLATHICSELRNRPETAGVPILVLGNKIAGEALKGGADVVLPKPVHPKLILEWAGKLLWNYERFKRHTMPPT